jgi:branched-chain amino acid aminotransferase
MLATNIDGASFTLASGANAARCRMSSQPCYVWMNGQITPLNEARVSPFDQGLAVGDGVFETLVHRGGEPVSLGHHQRRLARSCDFLKLPAPTEQQMREAFLAVMNANQMHSARLRFTITRGEPGGKPNMIAVATKLHQWPAVERVWIVPWKRNPHSALVGIKSLSYGENIIALNQAKAADAGEAIFANTRDELCEGTGSNVFVVIGEVIVTPPLSSGCLPGVTRELVVQACIERGIAIEERVITMDEFSQTDEAFLTSSTRDVHPISHINDRVLNTVSGTLTLLARRAYLEALHIS